MTQERNDMNQNGAEVVDSEKNKPDTETVTDAADLEAETNGSENGRAPEEALGETVDAAVQDDARTGDSTAEVSDESAESLTDAELIEQLREQLAAAEAKADEHWDRLQRTAAEYQNSRRRQEKQLTEKTEQANAQLIGRLLPILDDLGLAFDNLPASLVTQETDMPAEEQNGNEKTEARAEDSEVGVDEVESQQRAWLAGFRQIQKKLLDVLIDQGLAVIDTSGPFDPTRHEAISSEPNDEVESGHIIATLRAGYEFRGRVLRPALVRVAL